MPIFSNQVKFYSEILLSLLLIIVLIVSIRKNKQHPMLKFFPVYTGLLLLIYVDSIIINFCNDIGHPLKLYLYIIHHYVDHVFTLFELLIFIYFFQFALQNSVAKKILLIAGSIFLLYFIYSLVLNEDFPFISEIMQAKVYTIEALILIFPCIYYFWEVFKHPPEKIIKNNPAFWVTTGLFFFMLCTFPYSILEAYLRKKDLETALDFYSLFHIFYILLFLMIIRAYLCNPVEIKDDTHKSIRA